MGFLSGISSFVKEHSEAIHGVLDVAGFIPGVGAVADLANAALYASEGDWLNAASSVVSAIPGIGDTAALASKSAKAVKAGLKGMKEMSALSKAKGMKSMLKVLRGKAKTGAKKAGQKLKDLWGSIKKIFKKKCTGDKCFTGDTPVFTSRGYRLIKEMQKGDDIYSRNAQTGETGIQEVEEVFCTGTHTVYHIWLDGKEEIKTTAYHPIYVQEQGWVSAINLREGDIVETMDGAAQVTKIVKVRHEEKVPTYNLHVKEWASYFVGKIQVFVHNGGGHGKGKHSKGKQDKKYKRPSGYRKGVREQVWEQAVKDSPDGVVRSPGGKIINKGDNWQMGHKPGYEFRKHAESAKRRGITRKEFLDEHNIAKHYRPELPEDNWSHLHEGPDDLNFWK